MGNSTQVLGASSIATCASGKSRCLCSLKVKTISKNTTPNLVWSYPEDEKISRIEIVDNGEGCTVEISQISICEKNTKTCPIVTLNGEKLLTGTGNKQKQLVKKADEKLPQSFTEVIEAFLLSGMDLFSAFFDNSQRYSLISISCPPNKIVSLTIDVSPGIVFSFATSLLIDISSRARTTQELQKEQAAKTKAALEAMKKTPRRQELIKDQAYLRSGWTTNTNTFQVTRNLSLEVEFGLKVGQRSLTAKIGDLWKKESTHYGTKKQLNNGFNRFLSLLQGKLLPAPDNANSKNSTFREYKTFDMVSEPIKLGIAYEYTKESKNNKTRIAHFVGFVADPLFDIGVKIDLLQLIADYYHVGDVVKRVRRFMSEKANAEFECYLQITVETKVKFGGCYEKNWSFEIGNDNSLALKIKGVVSVEFNTRVLFVEAALAFNAEVWTRAGFALDKKEEGLYLAAFHDGIKAKIDLDIQMTIGGSKRGNDNPKPSLSNAKEFVIAKEMKAEDSPMRWMLIGKEQRARGGASGSW